MNTNFNSISQDLLCQIYHFAKNPSYYNREDVTLLTKISSVCKQWRKHIFGLFKPESIKAVFSYPNHDSKTDIRLQVFFGTLNMITINNLYKPWTAYLDAIRKNKTNDFSQIKKPPPSCSPNFIDYEKCSPLDHAIDLLFENPNQYSFLLDELCEGGLFLSYITNGLINLFQKYKSQNHILLVADLLIAKIEKITGDMTFATRILQPYVGYILCIDSFDPYPWIKNKNLIITGDSLEYFFIHASIKILENRISNIETIISLDTVTIDNLRSGRYLTHIVLEKFLGQKFLGNYIAIFFKKNPKEIEAINHEGLTFASLLFRVPEVIWEELKDFLSEDFFCKYKHECYSIIISSLKLPSNPYYTNKIYIYLKGIKKIYKNSNQFEKWITTPLDIQGNSLLHKIAKSNPLVIDKMDREHIFKKKWYSITNNKNHNIEYLIALKNSSLLMLDNKQTMAQLKITLTDDSYKKKVEEILFGIPELAIKFLSNNLIKLAVFNGNPEEFPFFEHLLSIYGPSIVDGNGNTLLHLQLTSSYVVSTQNMRKFIAYLIDQGVNPDIPNHAGITARRFAVYRELDLF